MAALTSTFTANTIAVGPKHNNPAPSTAPILGARRSGSITQVTRGNGVWEIWDTYDDPEILSPNNGGAITLINSVTTLQVTLDFVPGTGIFTNSPFAVSTDLINWTSPTWTDPITTTSGFYYNNGGGGVNTSYVNHSGSSYLVLYDRFILVRQKDILISADGVNWTSGAFPTEWPYFGNVPGSNNGATDVVERVVATSGNKLQAFISTYISPGYLANAWQTNVLESSDYGSSWSMKMSFYGYQGIGDVHIINSADSLFPTTALSGEPNTGEVTQTAYDITTGTMVLAILTVGLGVDVFRSFDHGANWYASNGVLHLFQKYQTISGTDYGTVPFTLIPGNGKWVMYMASYPNTADAPGWFYISGNDWTNGSGGYATWTRITVNGNAQPNWMNANVKPVFDGTNWIFKDSWRGLQSTDLTTWTAIPMKPKLAANTEGETFFGED
jgi:hypothetical protein